MSNTALKIKRQLIIRPIFVGHWVVDGLVRYSQIRERLRPVSYVRSAEVGIIRQLNPQDRENFTPDFYSNNGKPKESCGKLQGVSKGSWRWSISKAKMMENERIDREDIENRNWSPRVGIFLRNILK